MNNLYLYLKYLDFESTVINGVNQKIPTVNITLNLENAGIIKDIYKSLIQSYSSKECPSENKDEIVDIYKDQLDQLNKDIDILKRVSA